ncbi:MAG TPA: hypothetical protein VGL86_26805 [Polyangia bacterium]|jgi:hypothetical protein
MSNEKDPTAPPSSERPASADETAEKSVDPSLEIVPTTERARSPGRAGRTLVRKIKKYLN